MRRKLSVFLTFEEAARRSGITSSGIRDACNAGHMKVYAFGEVGKHMLWRAVDQDDFEHWLENRQPPGRKPKRLPEEP